MKLVITNISRTERIVRYITKYFYICNHPDSIALYRILSNVCFGLQLYIILLILLDYRDVSPLNSTVNLTDSTPPLLVLGYMIVLETFQYNNFRLIGMHYAVL